MRRLFPTLLFPAVLAGLSSCLPTAARSEDYSMRNVVGQAGARETPQLRERLTGMIVTVKPVGGIIAIDLPGLQTRELRSSGGAHTAVHGISEPDAAGRVVFVDGGGTAGRHFNVQWSAGGAEKLLFTGKGDPLWDHAISPLSLSPTGERIAYVVQQPGNEGRQYQPLVKGPLHVWDSSAGVSRDLSITSTDERPSWFPDGQRLAYVSPASASDNSPTEPSVHIVDTRNSSDTVLAPGHLPLVSTDGKTVLLMRGKTFEIVLVDVATRRETMVPRVHGFGTAVALFDSRYLVYKGKPTPGEPTGTTTNNSPLVGEKPMLAVKVLDLKTGEFATLIPLIDPRSAVTARGHATVPNAK
ncbi:MAG: hypothetical protein ABI905_06535 [Betaproteobacteria bacterium]